MCGSGTRAGYVKDALESIGYTNVYNVGGIRDYKGDHKIFGDESFSLEPSVVISLSTPGPGPFSKRIRASFTGTSKNYSFFHILCRQDFPRSSTLGTTRVCGRHKIFPP